MYIAQYGPRDIIFDESNTLGNQIQLKENSIILTKRDQPIYLALVLPEVVLTTIRFKFFIYSTSQFRIAVDNFTNVTEDVTIDYLNPSRYINEVTTALVNVTLLNTVSVLTYDYSGFGHKIAQDRCMFRINGNVDDCKIAGIHLRAV